MVGKTREFWDRVAPIQTEIREYNDIQGQVHAFCEKWEHTTRPHVHAVLTEIVETVLPGWSVTNLDKNSGGVTLIMPQRKIDEAEPPVTYSMRALSIGTLGFGQIHNGRIAILMSFPRSKDEPNSFNMLDIVSPNTLTANAICLYVADYIRQVTEWSKMDRTEPVERDNKEWR